jgi:5,10-methylenetetrahydromethanopterin reductase
MAAAAHGAAVLYHVTYHGRGWGAVTSLPGGDEWQRRAEELPARTRHLAIYAGHLVATNALDRGVVTGDVLAPLGVALDTPTWQARLAESARVGVTEIVYQPAGPDIARELTAFAAMAGL